MKKLSYLLLLATLILSNVFSAIPSEVFASANDFVFKNYTADFYLKKKSDGTSEMEVTETFVAEFPDYNQNHGIERKIPFLNQNDTNLTIESPDTLAIEVTRNGNSEKFLVSAYDTYFNVRIGDPDVYVHGTQTYVLKYKFVNVITDFSSSYYSTTPYQELYWDSNGTGWSQKFENVDVNLRMSPDIYHNLKSGVEVSSQASYKNKNLIHQNNSTKNRLAAWCYVGSYGSSNQNRCTISDLENGLNFHASNLNSRENLTFVTNFNENSFVVPENNYIRTTTYNSAAIDYYLSKNSDGTSKLKVKEKLGITFPTGNTKSTVTRHIPFVNQNGTNFITENQEHLDVKVKIDGKETEKFSAYPSYSDEGYFNVEIGDYSSYFHDKHTFEIEYEYKNIILEDQNKESQELSLFPFEVFSDAFEKIDVNVHLDGNLKKNLKSVDVEKLGSIKAYCANGWSAEKSSGKNTSCETNETSDGFTFSSDYSIKSKNFYFTIFFEDGTFVVPEPNKNYLFYHIFALFIIVFGGIVFFVYRASYKSVKGKIDYLKHRPVAPQYSPLSDLTAAQAAEAYLRSTKNPKVATLLELIVNKKIALKKGKKKMFGGYEWSGEVTDLSNISNEQRDLLKILGNGEQLSHIGDTFDIKRHSYSSALESAFINYGTHITHDLKQNGYFENKEKTNKYSKASGVYPLGSILKFFGILFLAIIGFNLFFAIIFALWGTYVELTGFTKFSIFEGSFLLPAMIILALVIFTTLPIMSINAEKYKKRTEKGLDVTNYLDGLKLYIKMAEADRLKFLQSVEGVDTTNEGIVKLNEKLLPYAALFGLEKSWMKELEKYYELNEDMKPDWYNAGLTYAVFRDISSSSMSRPADPSSSSSGGDWSSSSSFSGGGGGGFSGGGGGGGGGGGW